MVPVVESFHLSLHGQIPRAASQRITALKTRVCELEEQISRNSAPSNCPSSSDFPFKESGDGSKKTPQKRREKTSHATLMNAGLSSPGEIQNLPPEVCPYCGGKKFKKSTSYSSQHIECTAKPVIVRQRKCSQGIRVPRLSLKKTLSDLARASPFIAFLILWEYAGVRFRKSCRIVLGNRSVDPAKDKGERWIVWSLAPRNSRALLSHPTRDMSERSKGSYLAETSFLILNP